MSDLKAPIEGELKRIYGEDQKDRREKLWEKDAELMQQRDDARLKRVLELVGQNQLKTPAHFLYAATVLQHGSEVRHYEMAYEFAKRAADEGYKEQKGEIDPLWLSAAAKDRALMRQGKPQRYGTQIRRDSADGPWYVYEVDPSVTDEERAGFHVRSLAESYRRAEEMNKQNKPSV